MESDYGELAWRARAGQDYICRPRPYLAKSDCCDLCDLTVCVSIVSCSWTWPFFMSKVTKYQHALHTVFRKRHCVECFFYVETYKIPIHAPHTVSDPNRTQCGVLFICRKLQNSEAHFSTTVHIHTYIRTGLTTNTRTSTGTYVFAHIGLKAPVLV